MDDGLKWIFIGVALIMAIMFAGIAFEENNKQNCRLSGIKANISASDIQAICGK